MYMAKASFLALSRFSYSLPKSGWNYDQSSGKRLSVTMGRMFGLMVMVLGLVGGNLSLADTRTYGPVNEPCTTQGDIFVDNTLAFACTAGDYSIANRNCTGSDGDAYTSLPHAISNSGASDVILLREGTYAVEGLAFPDRSSGQGNLVKPYNCESATITGTIVTGDNLTLAGLNIKNTQAISGATITSNTNDGLIMRNNRIEGGGGRVWLPQTVTNCTIDGNDFANASGDIRGPIHGKVDGGCVISNNRFRNDYPAPNGEDLIQIVDWSGGTIVIEDNWFDSEGHENAIDLKRPISTANGPAHIIVRRNRFDGADIKSGCLLAHGADLPFTVDVQNNVMTACYPNAINYRAKDGSYPTIDGEISGNAVSCGEVSGDLGRGINIDTNATESGNALLNCDDSPGDWVPNAFSFSDQTNAALETVVTSSIVQITGLTQSSFVQLAGQGNPEMRICADASCSTVNYNWSTGIWDALTISNNQYIQLSMTSSAAANTTHSATVTIGGVVTDRWDVTTGTSASVSSSSAENIYLGLEAESSILTSPMQAVSDPDASGGQYVWVPEGTGNNINNTTYGGPGQTSLRFTVTDGGTYRLWARVKAGGGLTNSDSFYVLLDGSLLMEWWQGAFETVWKWLDVTDMALTGNHTVTFRQREDGAQIDRIIITNDLSFVPAGMEGGIPEGVKPQSPSNFRIIPPVAEK
jgi:hypothetical protein